jgi:hypothetical protein
MDGKFAYLGEPNIDFQGLRIWVHGRQFPEGTGGYWDGNWLRVTIHYHSANSNFILENDPAIHLSDLYQLQLECAAIKDGKKENADVEFIEPYLHFKFDFKTTGEEFRFGLEIPVVEKHEYTIGVSKIDLKLLLTQLDDVFVKYPLIGKP